MMDMDQHKQRYTAAARKVGAWTADNPDKETPKELRLEFGAAYDALLKAMHDWRFDDGDIRVVHSRS